MRTGTLNRNSSLKFKKSESLPVYLTPTKTGSKGALPRGIDEESQESEVENPVIVSYRKKKKNNNHMAVTGYNMDLEPAGRQTSGQVSHSEENSSNEFNNRRLWNSNQTSNFYETFA